MNRSISNRKSKLISKNEIGTEIREVEEASGYYIDPKGKIYSKYGEDQYFPMKGYVNKRNGYMYNTLMVDGKHKTFRTHILAAHAYIPNPDNLPVVGHKDNNKANPAVDNLEYCTYSENTQKAVNDGLLVNDKGFDDSQSHPIAAYNINKDRFDIYGSAREAHRELGVSVSTVMRHLNKQVNSTRCGYIFLDMYELADRIHFKFSNDYRNHT